MQAMILAAGRGNRLRPMTDTLPKPLVMVGERSLIEHHLVRLSAFGITHVVINVAYLGEKIIVFLGDGSRFGLRISYSIEADGALGTAGGIMNALHHFKETPFLVINSDIFTDYDFSRIQMPASSMAHIVLTPNPAHNPNGDYCLIDGKVRPACPTQDTLTFAGIGLYRKTLFARLANKKCDEKQNLAKLLEQSIHDDTLSGELHQTRWIDVGSADRLAQARARADNIENG